MPWNDLGSGVLKSCSGNMKYGIGVAGVCFSSRELGVFHFISSSVAIGGTRGWDVIAVRPTGDALEV